MSLSVPILARTSQNAHARRIQGWAGRRDPPMNTDYLKAGSMFLLTGFLLIALSIKPPHLDPM